MLTYTPSSFYLDIKFKLRNIFFLKIMKIFEFYGKINSIILPQVLIP